MLPSFPFHPSRVLHPILPSLPPPTFGDFFSWISAKLMDGKWYDNITLSVVNYISREIEPFIYRNFLYFFLSCQLSPCHIKLCLHFILWQIIWYILILTLCILCTRDGITEVWRKHLHFQKQWKLTKIIGMIQLFWEKVVGL